MSRVEIKQKIWYKNKQERKNEGAEMNYDNEIIIRQNAMIIKLLKIETREKQTEEDKKNIQKLAEDINKAGERRKEGIYKKALLS